MRSIAIRRGAITLLVLLFLAFLAGTVSAGVPGDTDDDTYISEDELSDAIIQYMEATYAGDAGTGNLSRGALSIAAHGYLSPGAGDLKAVMIFFKDSLDPANGWMGWYVREAGIYETLFYLDENAVIKPELATGYDQISDTEWRIHLRKGVLFHDGTPFTADAVVYSLDRVIDPDNSRHTEYDFIQSITKDDDYNITITTTEPYAPTIASLADPLCSIVSPALEDPANEASGTGPFMLESWEPKASVSLVKNPCYWGGDVKLHSARIDYIDDPTARALSLQSGDADLVESIPASYYEALQSDPAYQMMSKTTLRDYFMFVNTGKPPLNNTNVRQALNYAIDRQGVVDSALEGVGGTAELGIFPSIMPWSASNRGLTGYDYNPTKAKELLAAAGVTDTDGDGWLDYDGAPFTLTIETYTSRPALPAASNIIADQFEQIGIKTTVKELSSSAVKEDMSDGTYDLAMYSYGVGTTGDPDYILSLFAYSGATEAKWCCYSNPTMDAWIEEARQSMMSDQRQALYDQIQQQLVDDSPQIYVFSEKQLTGASTAVTGYKIYPNEVTFLTKDIGLSGDA